MKEIWSLNSRYEIMPYMPTRQLWTDITFFLGYRKDLVKLKDKGCEELIAREVGEFYKEFDITVYRTTAYKDIAEQKEKLFTSLMGLSGFFALSVAVMRGYKEIYLLGFDNPDQKCNVSKDFDYYLQFKDAKIINFPTKDHWRYPSQLNYVDNGLILIERVHHIWGIKINCISCYWMRSWWVRMGRC